MSIQKLHYENLGGMLIRREGLLNWRCPLCKAEGQSPEVMRACPECGSKEATLSGAQPAPSVPDVDALAQFIREIDGKHQLGAGALAERIVEWLAAAPEAKP